jgi:hypothetical protein
VNRRTLERLYAGDMQGYIACVAIRHFRDEIIQKEARDEAWEKINACPAGLPLAQYKKIAYRVINAKYKRWRRLHQREVRMA